MITTMANLIPLDHSWHEVDTNGPVLHAAALSETTVKVWTEERKGEGVATKRVWVRAYPTGAAVEGEHIATAVTRNGVAWHLYWMSR